MNEHASWLDICEVLRNPLFVQGDDDIYLGLAAVDGGIATVDLDGGVAAFYQAGVFAVRMCVDMAAFDGAGEHVAAGVDSLAAPSCDFYGESDHGGSLAERVVELNLPPTPLFQRGVIAGGLSSRVLFINVGKSLFGKEGFREISS